jgi:hypothetical protein
MRIFGGQDYYDVGLSLGIDKSITLVRSNNTVIDMKKLAIEFPSVGVDIYGGLDYTTVDTSTIVFCGKVYRGMHIHEGSKGIVNIWNHYKLEEWKASFKVEPTVRFQPGYWGKRNYKPEEYFRPFDCSDDIRKLMIDNKFSILVGMKSNNRRDEKLVNVNPYNLKMLGFAKALDPYQAFQELSMWIGGVLGGTSPEIVTIKDDIVLAESHGFDKVTSFRGPRIK